MSEAPNRLVSILLCGAALVLGSEFAFPAAASAQDDVPAKALKPYVSFSGANSRIDQQSYHLVTSAKDWAKLWLRHVGADDVDPTGEFDYYFYNPAGIPEVDFDKCMVIAVFRGKTNLNIAGVQSVILEGAEQTTVRFREKAFSTGGNGKPGSKADVTPYGFFVVRRSQKPLVMEIGERQYKNEPYVWKEVFRFPKRSR